MTFDALGLTGATGGGEAVALAVLGGEAERVQAREILFDRCEPVPVMATTPAGT